MRYVSANIAMINTVEHEINLLDDPMLLIQVGGIHAKSNHRAVPL
jgi:hypothetical protein